MRQLKRSLEDMGAIRDAIVVNILSYAGYPIPRRCIVPILRLEKTRGTSKPQIAKAVEKKERLRIIACEQYAIWPNDPGYEDVAEMTPGQRLEWFRKNALKGPLKYPSNPF